MTATIKYGGVDLGGLGLQVRVLDGLRNAPPIRGRNLLIPYQDGQRWVRKYSNERPIILAGKVTAASAIALATDLDQLKALFPLASGEQKLEVSQPDGSLRYILAEPRNLLFVADAEEGLLASTFSIELVASDPFWYGSTLQAPPAGSPWTFDSGVLFDDGAHWFGVIPGALFAQTLTAQQTVVAARNDGTTFNRKPVFTLTGATIAPKITNLTNGYSVQVSTTQIAGRILVIDCGLQVATVQGIADAARSITLGASQGSDWMRLEAGDNNLLIDLGAVSAPSVAYQLSFSPAYL